MIKLHFKYIIQIFKCYCISDQIMQNWWTQDTTFKNIKNLTHLKLFASGCNSYLQHFCHFARSVGFREILLTLSALYKINTQECPTCVCYRPSVQQISHRFKNSSLLLLDNSSREGKKSRRKKKQFSGVKSEWVSLAVKTSN